jgi:hypothetical protein
VPFGAGALEHPPVAALHVSMVHGLPSSHGRVVPALQDPVWHVSVPLQTSPSEQLVPLARGTFTQPVDGRQPSNVQAFESSHESGKPGRQRPLMHCSVPLQRFVSAHEVPSVAGRF